MVLKKLQYKFSIGLMFFFAIVGDHQQFCQKSQEKSDGIDMVEQKESTGTNKSLFSSISIQTKTIPWVTLTFLGLKGISKYQNSKSEENFQKNKDYTKQLKVKTINLKNQFEKNNGIKSNNPLDNNDYLPINMKNDGVFMNINRKFSTIEALIDDAIKSNKNKEEKKNNIEKKILLIKHRNKDLERDIQLLDKDIKQYENDKVDSDNRILATKQKESWEKYKQSINV